jgi:hypothetical protein
VRRGDVVDQGDVGTGDAGEVGDVAGLADPILYVGSFSEWSRSAMPVATGADPGEPLPRNGR